MQPWVRTTAGVQYMCVRTLEQMMMSGGGGSRTNTSSPRLAKPASLYSFEPCSAPPSFLNGSSSNCCTGTPRN